jgi:hypothetical protein
MGIFGKLFGGQKYATRNPTHLEEPRPPGAQEGQRQIAALDQAATAHAQNGNTAACELALEEAIRLCHQFGEASYLLRIADRLASMMAERGDHEGALRMLSLNEELYLRVSNGYLLACSMHTRGILTRNAGDKLGAMSLFQHANENCNAMINTCKKLGNVLSHAQVLKLQRRILWDMSPEAAEAIGFDRTGEYVRVLDEWVAVSKQASNPEQIAQSLELLAISPYHQLSGAERLEILDAAFQTAAARGLTDLAESIARTQLVVSLTGVKQK